MPKNWLNYGQRKLMTDFSQKTIFKINDIKADIIVEVKITSQSLGV